MVECSMDVECGVWLQGTEVRDERTYFLSYVQFLYTVFRNLIKWRAEVNAILPEGC